MSSRCLNGAPAAPFVAPIVAFALALASVAACGAERELRVCADPDNLPYSDASKNGFENRIAQVIADEIGAKLAYTWFPQRRAFLRNTLDANACDVVIGVPSAFDRVRTTRPYYRSTYVFVSRPAIAAVRSFDDPRLKSLKVGVQLVGDDLAATPPGHALAARGIIDNVRGFPVYGARPQAELMVEALAAGTLDVALIWGPQAAWYARRQRTALSIAAAAPELAAVPFEFSMSMGVRKSDTALQQALDSAIERRASDLHAILLEFGVPLVGDTVAAHEKAALP